MAFDPETIVRQYGDPAGEVRACRTDCALFDFSFIAAARVRGPGALDAIGRLTTRPLGHLKIGHICYAMREGRDGYLVSDLTVWRHADHYQVMSGRLDDIADLIHARPPASDVEDESAAIAIFAVQGPRSLSALAQFLDVGEIARLTYFTFATAKIGSVACVIGRLGYSGEAGFEIVLPRPAARDIWRILAQRVRPAGFIAADILRIEAGFVLFANEFRIPVRASEAGFARFAAARYPVSDARIELVCFRARTRDKPVLWRPGGPIGRPTRAQTIVVTSACDSPIACGTLGLGYVLRPGNDANTAPRDPSGIFSNIEIVPRPLYDPQKRRPKAAWVT
ncbi:MAG: hypothetical protein HY056_15000 [Proteobacteria bacterium]|nr:hypothetical protein [Pseudomonadota bacterium]